MKYYSVMRKKILLFVITWIELEDTILCEISQPEKTKYCIV